MLGILFFVFSNLQAQTQNLVLNPKLFIEKRNSIFDAFGMEGPIQWGDTLNSLFLSNVNWHRPWSSLSNCRYHVFINGEDTVQSEFVFGLNSALPDYMLSRVVQGELCRNMVVADSVYFSMKIRFQNQRKRWNRKVRLLISVSDSAINRWEPTFQNSSNQQIVYSEYLKKHLKDSVIQIEFRNNIDFRYFQIAISTSRKRDYNYIYIYDFFLIGQRTKSCRDFTF